MKPIPKVGKTYKFYDDGKIRESRQYDATVLRIIARDEARQIKISMVYDCPNPESKEDYMSLYNAWQNAIKAHTCGPGAKHIRFNDDWSITEIRAGEPWLYASDTDYFIECSVPDYDEHSLWFARTIWGAWFSMDIEDCWMGGILDVDNTLTNELNLTK